MFLKMISGDSWGVQVKRKTSGSGCDANTFKGVCPVQTQMYTRVDTDTQAGTLSFSTRAHTRLDPHRRMSQEMNTPRCTKDSPTPCFICASL